MAKKFLTPIDLSQLELQNVRLQNLASAPASPVVGQVYFNTTTDKAMVWDGTDWIPWEVGASVQPATATPLMDGTAAVGTSLKYAREDHVHPATSQVQSNWTEADNTQPSYIQNKPTIGTAAAKSVDASITSGSTSQNLPTSEAVANFVSTEIGAADAMRFKGTLGVSPATIQSLPNTHKIGDTYRVVTAGTYAGQVCEVGDLIIAMTTSGTTSADWCVAQTNIDGALTNVTGSSPISASVSGSTATVTHENSGVTAGSYGDSSAQTPAFGGTFKALYATVNATGHVTALSAHNVTIPSLPTASLSAAGIVQLNNSTSSTSITEAATANAVKTAYDFAKIADEVAIAACNNHTTETITAGTTSVTATQPTAATIGGLSHPYSYRSYTAFIGTDEVVVDTSVSSGIPTFTIASAITSDIDILIIWGI